MRGAPSRQVRTLPLALAALAGLAAPAAAQDAFAPCLAAHDSLDGYVAGFEAEGWTLAEGDVREAALLGPAEVYFRAMMFPDPETTLDELERTLAEVREWAPSRFDEAAILTRGEASAAVRLFPGTPTQVLCIVTAANLPEVDTFLGQAEPSPFGGLAMRSYEPGGVPGTADIRVDMIRIVREVKPPEPLPGTEAVLIGFELEAP